jgi:hypothetical protein
VSIKKPQNIIFKKIKKSYILGRLHDLEHFCAKVDHGEKYLPRKVVPVMMEHTVGQDPKYVKFGAYKNMAQFRTVG